MEITKDSKISISLVIALAAGAWTILSYSRNVEATIASERAARQKLEERVAWVILNNDQQQIKIDRIDENVRKNGKQLSRLVAYVEGNKND